MRKTLLITIGILFVLNIQAQNEASRKQYREKMKVAKVAFITTRLDLSSETAQVFWPIFNDYEKEKSTLGFKYYEQKKQLVNNRDYSNMSEADERAHCCGPSTP